MKWRDRRRSTNVVDRRGTGGGRTTGGLGGMSSGNFRLPRIGTGGGSGGLGIGGLVVVGVVIIGFVIFSGGDLGSLFAESGGTVASDEPATDLRDEQAQFVATVLGETETIWGELFAAESLTYVEPTLVLFSGSTQSACGFASAASGPFYCPADERVYIDLSFYDELSRRFGAPGDFAQAYVIAHEIGHHVQNLLGDLAGPNTNENSIRVELQADCYAGVWGYYVREAGILEAGDLNEALNAASQIGDDAIQRREQGYVVPESFNHGTSEQRAEWFQRGFQSGDPGACDTFSARL